MRKLTILLCLICPFILNACGQPTTSEKVKAYHDNSEIIGEEKDDMVANISDTIYESADRENTQREPIIIEAIAKEGEEVQVPEGRYTITGQLAGTVTVKDNKGDILYETSIAEEGSGVGMITLDLTEDHTIHVDGFEEAFIHPAEAASSNELGPGIWEVGKDIEPGKFSIEGSNYGYLQLFTEGESPQVYELHGDLSEPIKVELKEGQKVKITDVSLVQFNSQN